jgi:glycerophosphoryl diester phosphodiesterase
MQAVIILFSLFTAFGLPPAKKDSLKADRKVVIIGHRGAAGLAPENTLSAMEAGIHAKAGMLEIDIRQSKDSFLVVMHDKTINRTCNGKGNIKNLHYKELLTYSAGEKFSQSFINEKIPTLEEILTLVNGRCDLMIEIKRGNSYYPGIVARTINTIKKHGAERWCIINSFHADILSESKKLSPEIRICKSIIGKVPGLPIYFDKGPRIASLRRYKNYEQLNYMYKFGNKKFIQSMQAMHVKVFAWTVNKSKWFEKLKNRGVDGIITNYPNYGNLL